jgi:hypothetical protein
MDKLVVSHIPFDDIRLVGNRRPTPRRQIVYDNDVFTRVEQAQNHMTANVTSPTGDQDGHLKPNTPGVSVSRPARQMPSLEARATRVDVGLTGGGLEEDEDFTAPNDPNQAEMRTYSPASGLDFVVPF